MKLLFSFPALNAKEFALDILKVELASFRHYNEKYCDMAYCMFY